MNKSLLQYAYVQYASDIPHTNIIQGLINKGVEFDQAQQILDTAIIMYCTKATQTAQPQSAPEEEMSFGSILNLILTVLGLIITVAKCSSN
jgi:hypothetical protein